MEINNFNYFLKKISLEPLYICIFLLILKIYFQTLMCVPIFFRHILLHYVKRSRMVPNAAHLDGILQSYGS